MIKARLRVPSGTPVHASGGEKLPPSFEYFSGIVPSCAKALLVKVRFIVARFLLRFATEGIGRARGIPPTPTDVPKLTVRAAPDSTDARARAAGRGRSCSLRNSLEQTSMHR